MPGVLSLARGRLGTFGILGNHDDWAGRDAVATAVRASGVTLLGNGCAHVEAGNGSSLQVCGCEEPWTRDRLLLLPLKVIIPHTFWLQESLPGKKPQALHSYELPC